MRRLAASAIAWAALLCGCGAVLLGPADTKTLSGTSEWVIVVYMTADASLDAQAVEDLNEMEAGLYDLPGVTVLALLDRGGGSGGPTGDWAGTRLYRIVGDPGGMDRTIKSIRLAVPALGLQADGPDVRLAMGDPATLRAVLEFAREQFPAEHMGLVIWGHGSGYRHRATGSASDPLHTAELAEAIAGLDLDLVGLDTCFGASLEVAWEIRDHARMLVASQDLVPADGWEYDTLLSRFGVSDRSPASLAVSIVDAFRTSYPTVSNATISAVDLARIDGVMEALDAFALAVHALAADAPTRDAIRATLFHDVEGFYATPGDLAIDVGHMAEVIGARHPGLREQADALATAVEASVRSRWSNPAGRPNALGLSVHLIPLGPDGTALAAHDASYVRGAAVSHPLAFVAASNWPPQLPAGPGLLFRLFYEVL